MTDLIIRYVRNGDVPAYEAVGWIARPECFNGTHHGEYSTLCEWPMDKGEPVEPEDKDAR